MCTCLAETSQDTGVGAVEVHHGNSQIDDELKSRLDASRSSIYAEAF